MNRTLIFGSLGLAGIALAAYAVYFADSPADHPVKMSEMQIAGDDCTAIAEKSAMNLPEALPFQKLEKTARQARVMQTCMSDRGYAQNPKWLAYIEPIAEKISNKEHVSLSEAIETLSRNNMYVLKKQADLPFYWAAKH